MAAKAFMSPAQFSREFKLAYGETPYAYLMTRRIERAMALLRAGASVTDACTAVGAPSLGSVFETGRRDERLPRCIAKIRSSATSKVRFAMLFE